MWIKVIVWYKQEDEIDRRLEGLGIINTREPEIKYNPEAEGEMLLNTDKIIRINPSSDNPEYSVLWFSEEPAITIHVKHSLNYLQDVLSTGKYFDLT